MVPSEPNQPPPRPQAASNPLIVAPILPTLTMLALPNMLALGSQSLVAIVETTYIGLIGVEALAAMALVFPMIMLTQMMSSGAMGGGVSSAISRALGAGDEQRARALALHAIVVGASAGLLFTVVFTAAGPALYRLLGGSGKVLDHATGYSAAFFSGAISVWMFNTLVSVARGTGNMRVPSAMIIAVGAAQIVLGGLLGFGLGPFPGIGLPGIAVAQVLAFTLGAIGILLYLRSDFSRLRIGFSGIRLEWELFRDILKVGAVSCLSPLQSILTIILLAKFATGFGTAVLAGYGIGVRLELLLVPIAFSIGVACVPMVGMAIGAGNVARARRVAWTGATLSALLIGAIGCAFALFPWLWGEIFTDEAAVLDAVQHYLRIAGIAFAPYGFGLCLYFASQGSGRIMGPVLGGTVRLLAVAAGGFWLLASGGSFTAFSWLVAGAMLAYGAATGLFVAFTRWGRR